MYVYIPFATKNKKIYTFVKSRNDKYKKVYNAKYTIYTKLLHHKISNGGDSLKKLQKLLIFIRVSLDI